MHWLNGTCRSAVPRLVLAMVTLPALLALLPLLALPVDAAHARTAVFAGLAFPTGDLGEVAKTGYHLGGMLTAPAIPMVEIGGYGAYTRCGLEDANGDFRSYELLGVGRVQALVGPFGMIGAGLARSRVETDPDGGDWSTDFAWAIGGGYEMTLVELAILYHRAETGGGGSSWITVTAGLRF
jgi:hypothetical protein